MAIHYTEFEAAALQAAAEYPGLARRIQVGDPRVLAGMRANAIMLAMLSQQMDLCLFESAERARDTTVLADAAMRGILPLARPASVTLEVTNRSSARYMLSPGRRLIDQKGRTFVVTGSVSIDVGASGLVEATQRTERVVTFTASSATRYQRIEVPTVPAQQLAGLEVWRVRSDGRDAFEFRPDYCNTDVGDFGYTVEVDERRRTWIRFGAAGSVGYQVQPGDQFEIRVFDCEGAATGARAGDVFTFEYSEVETVDPYISMRLYSVDDVGADAPGMGDLRVLTRYPSTYDHNAVYLGNFQYLIRRYLSTGVRFLSCWNEQIEESVRGPSEDSINTLFVACLVKDMAQAEVRQRVESIIKRADDSYRIKHVSAVLTPVRMAITATVPAVHDEDAVRALIRKTILGAFGDGAEMVSVGLRNQIRETVIHRLLRESVQELRDNSADIAVSIELPDEIMPEHYLYVTYDSLTVGVSKNDHRPGLWNV
ncbi:hypothetical protein X805_23840 [Sphaerotilus natans subsp. natans DSM 6575]|uniref:Uncharacterized protein n=1 Tax=Sphaerotilus natans subsp. natans DSM 6575 TaxID=1286631 RepID=A0A059KLH0_9BURK|nr:hypothetical protein [Sphaerotilus natans]KDB52014.1 hypothetical protein X805_23840 [Sphaerotilus natans subsp. natans DSM 6575]SIQ08568.1 hypothetical protein SAMN05421778_101316 [Sphaerotilus natans]